MHAVPCGPWQAPATRVAPRPNSRRGQRRLYLLERLSTERAHERHAQRAPEAVVALEAAGCAGSALRRALKERDIDPKLARLVLCFYGRRELRVADVAWRLGVSPSTASRWLDRAERDGLVDKTYHLIDRRGTWARLTERGVALRDGAERVLRALSTYERPRGLAYGGRATRGRCE